MPKVASLRGEDAELVALRFSEAHPNNIAPADVGIGGNHGPQPVQFHFLVIAGVRHAAGVVRRNTTARNPAASGALLSGAQLIARANYLLESIRERTFEQGRIIFINPEDWPKIAEEPFTEDEMATVGEKYLLTPCLGVHWKNMPQAP